jgi:hypothetical protein
MAQRSFREQKRSKINTFNEELITYNNTKLTPGMFIKSVNATKIATERAIRALWWYGFLTKEEWNELSSAAKTKCELSKTSFLQRASMR